MKITKITPQQKRPNRYSVYVDGVFSFGLHEADIVRLGLASNQELSEAELAQLQAESEAGKLYERALAYLALRPRSSQEMRDYLQRKGASTTQQQDIMQRLREQSLINDADFARAWVEWRQATTPRSKRQLTAELRRKGVESTIIATALASIDDETERAQVVALIHKRQTRYDSRDKLMAYLARQGYSYDLIRQALEEAEEPS